MHTEIKVNKVFVGGQVRYVPIAVRIMFWELYSSTVCISSSMDTYEFNTDNVSLFSTETKAEANAVANQYLNHYTVQYPNLEVRITLE